MASGSILDIMADQETPNDHMNTVLTVPGAEKILNTEVGSPDDGDIDEADNGRRAVWKKPLQPRITAAGHIRRPGPIGRKTRNMCFLHRVGRPHLPQPGQNIS